VASSEDQLAVSVVIPSYNEEEHIRACLGSVVGQRTERRYEVLVVDSSNDATPDIVRADFPSVRLIRRDTHTPAAEARNLGIAQARAPVVAFLDADCVAAPSWIDAICAAHQSDHPVVGGSVSLAPGATLAGALLFAIEFSEFIPAARPRAIRWLPSCNLSVKRETLERHGGFPRLSDTAASEDILFVRHVASQTGRSSWFDPAIRIAHVNRETWPDARLRLRTLGYWSGRSRHSGTVPGGVLVRHPALIPLLVPYRFVLILARLSTGLDHRKLFALTLACTPLVLAGLASWARAFRRGVEPPPVA
jgi:glycosyltransferase involved in cell wall biosynthesis